ncbi:hypothetical protein, partial [Sphaerothrix gracilis]|uniref:hypothetical protein n=1 Tax=Sphaerothrix gracilis TaxID=3151835 RepID=UPI0031FD38F2
PIETMQVEVQAEGPSRVVRLRGEGVRPSSATQTASREVTLRAKKPLEERPRTLVALAQSLDTYVQTGSPSLDVVAPPSTDEASKLEGYTVEVVVGARREEEPTYRTLAIDQMEGAVVVLPQVGLAKVEVGQSLTVGSSTLTVDPPA